MQYVHKINFEMEIPALYLCFLLKLCASLMLYIHYKMNDECLKLLKESPFFEIDSKLKKKVEKNGGVIKYALISGSIKALSDPIKSHYISHLRGVLYERVTKELRWFPFLGSWRSASKIEHIVKYVPFALCSKTNSLSKEQVCVEVIEPLTARELIAPKVYDKFTPYYGTIRDAIVGFFCGERAKGLQEIERMVHEGMTFTAAGRLFVENNQLNIGCPDDVVKYFVTPLTKESLINKIQIYRRLSKIGFIIMSSLTFTLFIYISRRAFLEFKKEKIKNRERKLCEEQRKLRRMADRSRGLQDVNAPKCVICLHNPIEVLLLECEHTCLCFDCSELFETCPVCKKTIVRRVQVFWP